MSAGENKFGKDHLLGGVAVLRHANPRIRGTVRREDPDANPEPHWTGLTGTSLTIDLDPVTTGLVINFTSDNLDDVLNDVNTVSPANLLASEEDGYLVLRNLNGGGKNTLKIVSGDAAPILGFRLYPDPEGISYAGEVATAAAGRQQGQDNPPGTSLIAADEDLKSSVLNRAMAGLAAALEQKARELDGFQTLTLRQGPFTVTTHAGSGKKVIYIKSNTYLPLVGLDDSDPRWLDQVINIVDANDSPIIDIDQTTERRLRAIALYSEESGTGSAALDNLADPVWGTPNGKEINTGYNQDDVKVAAISISEVRGDIVTLGSALPSPVANSVKTGDTAVIAGATNNDPFNHNGEFVITEILDDTHVRLRPKSQYEAVYTVTASDPRPQGLNSNLPGGTDYGTLSVVVGNTWHMQSGVAVELPDWAAGSVYVRLQHVERISEMDVLSRLPRSKAPVLATNTDALLLEFKSHIVDAIAGRRHTAADVDAAGAAGSPDSLTAGTVQEQLEELLSHVNNLIAGQVTYGGGGTWYDGTTNPSTTLEAQVDKIIADLAATTGAAKIGYNGGPAWADATTNPATSIELQLDKLVTDLVAAAGAARIGGAAGPAWHDGTTNPADTIQAKLDKLITDLIANAGADRIGVAAAGGIVTAGGSIQDGLGELAAVSDLKWSSDRTFRVLSTDWINVDPTVTSHSWDSSGRLEPINGETYVCTFPYIGGMTIDRVSVTFHHNGAGNAEFDWVFRYYNGSGMVTADSGTLGPFPSPEFGAILSTGLSVVGAAHLYITMVQTPAAFTFISAEIRAVNT
jgi:hypothetical protein